MSNELLAFVNKLHDHSRALLEGVRFAKQFERDGYIVSLYASMIELTGGIIVLVERDRYAAVSAVFRTFLEAYVEFENIWRDPSYIKHCYARHHENWIKILKRGDETNPYLSGNSQP